MAEDLRHQTILARIRAEGRVNAQVLARQLGVSVQTVRRDLGALAEAGLIGRVHGGAVLPSGTRNIGYNERRDLRHSGKDAIGRATAARIPNGASIYLDIGTTSEAVARALLSHSALLVVTNNINVANILVASPEIEVVLAGGLLRRADGGLVGEATADFVRQFKVDTAVVGASAIDSDGDVLDFDFREVRVVQAVTALARRTILATDSSKLARTAPVRLGNLRDFDLWVTDQRPAADLMHACAGWRTEVVIAPQQA